MSFVNPWAAVLGVVALALPLAIHWLTRPRPVTLPLSTLRFVRQAVQERRARNRLRDALVLGLRMLAVLLLAWAVARPLLGEQALVDPEEHADAARVVVLDISHSMAAQAGGVQLFERARALAAPYLADQRGLRVNLILAGAAPRPVFDRLSTNGAALREALAAATPRPERLQVAAALNAAGELLARDTAPRQRRELVVITDLQRSNWAGADFAGVPQDTRIQFETVHPAAPLANLAIQRVGAGDRPEQGRETRLEVEVGNWSNAARKVQAELALESAVYRLEGLCPPGTTTVLSVEAPLVGAGWQVGAARLLDVDDALAADDRCAVALNVEAAPVYALVTRQDAQQRPSSSYYLERALAPGAGRSKVADARVLRIAPAAWDAEAAGAAAVLVLDHPGLLKADVVRALAQLLRRGRGLLYCLAEPEDAANVRALAEALGGEWQAPVDFIAPPVAARRKDLFLVDVKRAEIPFAVFGDELVALMSGLRFGGGLTTRRLERGLADDVLATLNDQSALLTVVPCGAGTAAMLNADLGASNLAMSPAFVPLLGELTRRLAGRQQAAAAFVCGEPASFQLPPSASAATGLRVVAADGTQTADGQIAEESGGAVWRVPRSAGPGAYRVQRGSQTVFAAAGVVPSEEADLRPLDPAVLRERLSGGRRVHVRSSTGGGAGLDDFWTWLAVACVMCLIGEVAALRWFSV